MKASTADRLFSGVSFLALRQMLGVAASVIAAVVLLRHLGAAEFGVLSLVISWIALASMLTGNFDEALRRFLPELIARSEMRRALRMTWVILVGRTALAVVVAAVLAIAAIPLAGIYGQPPGMHGLILVGCVQLIALSLDTASTSVFIGLQRYGLPAMTALVGALLNLVAVIVAVALDWRVEPYFRFVVALQAIWAIATVGIALGVVVRGVRNDRPGTTLAVSLRSDLRDIWRYAWPVWGNVTATVGYQHAVRAVLGLFVPVSVVGNYAVAKSIIDRLSGLFWQIPAALLPALTEKRTREGPAAVRASFVTITRWVWPIGCVAAMICMLFPSGIVQLLAGSDYSLAPILLLILAAQFILRFPVNVWGTLYYVEGRTRAFFRINVARLLLLLPLLFMVTPRFGAIGVAVLEVFSFVLSFVLLCGDIPRRFAVPPVVVRGPLIPVASLLGVALAGAWLLAWSGAFGFVVMATLPVALFFLGVLRADDLIALDATPFSGRWSRLAQRWISRALRASWRISLWLRGREQLAR